MKTMLRPFSLQLVPLALCLCLLELAGCSTESAEPQRGALFATAALENTIPTLAVAEEPAEVSFSAVTLDDIDCSVDMATATLIRLTGEGGSIRGAGATLDSGTLTIHRAGTYVMSGQLEGLVLVDAEDAGLVRIVLDNLTVSGQMQAPRCDKLLLILQEHSDNRISYTSQLEEGEERLPAAAVAVNAPLTINGGGSLAIESARDSGLTTASSLVVAGTSLTVNASSNALQSEQGILFLDSTVDIVAGRNGIDTASNSAGGILFSGGSYHIEAAETGLRSGSTLSVINSEVEVNAAGSGVSAAGGVLVLDGELLSVGGSADRTGGTGNYGGHAQPALLVSFESEQEAYSTVTLRSDDGDALAEIQPQTGYTSISVSTPTLELGDAVTFSVNGVQLARLTIEDHEQQLFLP